MLDGTVTMVCIGLILIIEKRFSMMGLKYMSLKWFGHQTLIGAMKKTSQWNSLFAKITATIMERRQRAMNSKIIRIIGLAATVIGLGANLINDWADEQKMNEQIDKKVNEALAKRDTNVKES